MAAKATSKVIKKDRLIELLDKLAEQYDLIAPIQNNTVSFKLVKTGSEVKLDFVNSVLSPKSAFFPQTETLFQFSKDDEGFKPKPETETDKERIIFGIRACDARSLSLLDMVFNGQHRDSYYLQKRAKTILIGMACFNPAETCFCHTFEIDPTSPGGVDILLTDIDDKYRAQALTEKGTDLLTNFAEYSHEPMGDETKLKDTKAAKLTGIKKLDITGLPDKMEPLYGGDYWESIGLKCLGCGICTYLCPTCHCFDLIDESRDEGGERFRSWDSCMFPDFTLMASGENPRPDQKARVQQRFFHKLKYFPDRYGEVACTGCGRCLKYCPVNINITQIIDDVMSGKARNE